jgi:hypothetical protein
MESRVRRKVQARFGEGDTPYPQGSTVPTLRPDHSRAQDGLCKHRRAKGLYRRASELLQAPQPQPRAVLADAPAPLPEAPASVNVHLTVSGRQIQLTLRDSDEGRLLQRLEAVLQRFPLVVTPTDTAARPEGWCTRHGVAMKLNHKDGRQWYSHKTAEGWCKGR